jgi:hypothetical protein
LWEPFITAYTPIKIGLPQIYGGYAKPKFGSRSFSPDLFVDDWEPPKTITVKDMLTDSTEAAAVTVFEGTLHLDSYNETEVTYNAYGSAYTTTINGTSLNSNLISLFTTYCGASYLNLTLDTTDARAATVLIDYNVDGEVVLIDEMSKWAAFACHAFYIDDGTLYLIDMLTGSSDTQSLDEFGYFMGSEYQAPEPVSLFKSEEQDGTKHSLDGAYKYGSVITLDALDDNTATNTTQMANTKTIVDKDYYRFRVVPEADKLPTIGQVVTVTNDSMIDSTTVEFVVTDYAVDLLKSEILIEGVGSVQ